MLKSSNKVSAEQTKLQMGSRHILIFSPPVKADFFLTSVAPDIAWVCYAFRFRFLNPGAHLIFVLEKAIATEDIALCEGCWCGLDEVCSHRETVDVFRMPPGGG